MMSFLTTSAQTRTVLLHDHWTVTEDGRSYPCTVPTTAMGVLTANGEYTHVLEAMNYKTVDKNRFAHPWTFTRQITLTPLSADQRVILHLKGVDYRADVKWNGKLIASRDTLCGPFRSFDLDVTDGVRESNTLEIDVFQAQDGEPNHGYVDWNVRPVDENMGLLRDISLTVADRALLSHTFVSSKVDTLNLAYADLSVSTVIQNVTDHLITGVLEGSYEAGQFSVPVTLKPRESRTVALHSGDIPALHVTQPRLWWCVGMGSPELYHLQLRFVCDGKITARQNVKFGIRQIDGLIDQRGHRAFRINGKPVLIRGGGWVDDIFMRNTPTDYLHQMMLVRDMGLNTVRFEGFWGTSDQAYSVCDSLGLMLMVGLSCQWEWNAYLRSGFQNEYSSIPDTPEMQRLVTLSLRDQVLDLRLHPSIICWMVGSDRTPYPSWERGFYEVIRPIDDRLIQISAAGHTTKLSGASGVKMSGPYEYEGPGYYFSAKSPGGADGFNTETCTGAQIPVKEDVIRTVGKGNEWPVRNNEYYNDHCTASTTAMNSLDVMTNVLEQRFGMSYDLGTYLQRANLIQMESTQAMFEAFRTNEPKSTGIIHWMLNSAWPSLYWQLYDWYGVPTSAYYGTKRANRAVQLTYDYEQRAVYGVNATRQPVRGNAHIEIYDMNSRKLASFEQAVTIHPGQPVEVYRLSGVNQDCELFLDFTDDKGIAQKSEYWVAKGNDEYDWKYGFWYMTPITEFASYKTLNALPSSSLKVKATESDGKVIVKVTNRKNRLAFFSEIVVLDSKGVPVPYACLTDNYLTLRPHETRILEVAYPAAAHPARLKIRTWNTAEKTVSIHGLKIKKID